MIEGLIHSVTTRIQTTFHSSTKKDRIILAIAGLAVLISLPFLIAFVRRLSGRISTPSIEDKSSENRSPAVERDPEQYQLDQPIDFQPYQLSLKTLTGQTLTLLIDKNETLLSFVSRATAQAAERDPGFLGCSYFDDLQLICAGKVLNTPATEYISMVELDKKYEFIKLATLHFVMRPRSDEFVSKCVASLKEEQRRISEVLSSIEWYKDPRQCLQEFRLALHSYCDRIVRGVDKADLKGLQTLISAFGGITIRNNDDEVKRYSRFLFECVSNVQAQFLQSYDGLIYLCRIGAQLLPAPEKVPPLQDRFGVIFQKWKPLYLFKDFYEFAKYCNYFDVMVDFPQLSDESGQALPSSNTRAISSIPDGVKAEAVHQALLYLEGENVSGYLTTNPFDLQRAANFLQIPRLQFLCEIQLIENLRDDRLEKKDIPEDLTAIKLEMPRFYRALALKGWLPR